jgi:hypothetical protein
VAKADANGDTGKARVAVYWNAETWRMLRHQGIREGRSASAVSEDAVRAYLDFKARYPSEVFKGQSTKHRMKRARVRRQRRRVQRTTK